MIKFTADKNGKLTKLALKNCADLSYSAFRKLLRNKDVKVNGKRVCEDVPLFAGDAVEIFCAPPKTEKFSVIYKDENVIVVDKKAGYLSEDVFGDLQNAGETYFIHRLDRNTAGVMIFARNARSENELLAGFKARTFIKTYRAEVVGAPPKERDVITAYLKKDAAASQVKIYGKRAVGAVKIKTGYKVAERRSETTVLDVTLFTGKTHQIRAHLAFIGCPIVGDVKYGDKKFNEKHGARTLRLFSESLTLSFAKTDALYYLNGKTFCRGKGE